MITLKVFNTDKKLMWTELVSREFLTDRCLIIAQQKYEIEIIYDTIKTEPTQQTLLLPETASTIKQKLTPIKIITKIIKNNQAKIIRIIKNVPPPAKEAIVLQFLIGQKSIHVFYLNETISDNSEISNITNPTNTKTIQINNNSNLRKLLDKPNKTHKEWKKLCRNYKLCKWDTTGQTCPICNSLR